MSYFESLKENWGDTNTPLHGVIIPSLLILFGIGIQKIEYVPYAFAIVAVFVTINLLLAHRRRRSLSSEKFRDFELIEKTIISRDSAIYRFKLFRESENLDIPVGHHVCCSVTIDGKEEIRYYTPISSQYDLGFFDILVKSYPTGTVSKYFAGLREGQTVKFKGPVGRMSYKENMSPNILMIGGGSGITPLLQVLSFITTTATDTTNVKLIFANETENDILLKEEIDELNEKYPLFKVEYILNKPSAEWKGKKGLVTKDDIKNSLVENYLDNTKVFICGPMPMKKLMIEYCEELGFPKGTLSSKQDDQVFCF